MACSPLLSLAELPMPTSPRWTRQHSAPAVSSLTSSPRPKTTATAHTTLPSRTNITSSNNSGNSKPAASTVPSASPSRITQKKKNAVRFADASGKMLCRTQRFFRDDEPWRCNSHLPCPPLPAAPPKKISSPFSTSKRLSPLASSTPSSTPAPSPVLQFADSTPLHHDAMVEALAQHGVQLESVLPRVPQIFLTIRALNVCAQKHVFVRFTTDDWHTHKDIDATFGSTDGRSDRFVVSISLPSFNGIDNVQFAICYQTNDKTFWDNNSSKNYHVNVVPVKIKFNNRTPAASAADTIPASLRVPYSALCSPYSIDHSRNY